MKDYYSVSMPRYSRYVQRLRASRTVRFPNDVVFQDHIRQGDLEQVGRFIRARKVTLDTIYPSGECCRGWRSCSLRSSTAQRAARQACGPPSAGRQVGIEPIFLPSEEQGPQHCQAGPKRAPCQRPNTSPPQCGQCTLWGAGTLTPGPLQGITVYPQRGGT